MKQGVDDVGNTLAIASQAPKHGPTSASSVCSLAYAQGEPSQSVLVLLGVGRTDEADQTIQMGDQACLMAGSWT
jgi:hypothetical protein